MVGPKFRPAVASQSFGRAPHHHIEEKLALCAQYGFEAIEIFFEDLELAASTLQKSNKTISHEDALLAAATHIGALCTHHSLEVICIQPFANYEGLTSRSAHASRIQELHLWIKLAQRLGTDLIQIPSSYLPSNECSASLDLIISDLREACAIGARHNPSIRFAHEALAFATHHSRWTDVWDIVLAVDRPNFGCCLDTFNLLGREYADPASLDGKTPDADTQLAVTLHDLRTRLDPAKIFYIEAVDGERLSEPLVAGHEFYNAAQPPRMSWSRNARLFPLEEGGYLPVLEVLRAIEDVGYTGYVSFEFFSRTAHEVGEQVPREHAVRAQKSWKKLCGEMGWEYDERWARGWLKDEGGVVAAPAEKSLVQATATEVKVQAAARGSVRTSSPLLRNGRSRSSMPNNDGDRTPQLGHKQSWTASAAPVLQAH